MKIKKYQVSIVVEVGFQEGGTEMDVIKMEVPSYCRENAALHCFKVLDLDTIKFIRKETLKKRGEWISEKFPENNWETAISFELLDCKATVKKDDLK